MTCELGKVTPLEDLGMHRVGEKQMTRRSITWIRSGVLSSPDHYFNLPLDGPDHDCIRTWGIFFRGELVGDGIRLSILRAGTVDDGRIEPPKEHGPACLARLRRLVVWM